MKTQRIAAASLCAVVMFSPTIVQADVVLDWNEIMVTVVAEQPPTQMNRIAAITHLAVFEAVNAVTGEYKPYLAAVNTSHGVSADAAATVAAHRVLRHCAPDRAAFLDAARTRSLGRIPDGTAKAAGITVGEAPATTKTSRSRIVHQPPDDNRRRHHESYDQEER
ncbi:MAG TPA: hypothetical protein VK595_11865 [Vicinamibacterales bacterium]|nr:hypothetical protein [Vicinamibacterales bacterium]